MKTETDFKITPVRMQRLKMILSKQHQDAQNSITEAKLADDYDKVMKIADALGSHTEAVSDFLKSTYTLRFNESMQDLLYDIAMININIVSYVHIVRKEAEHMLEISKLEDF
ncbi:hypothetical protein C9E85_14710 [Plesiomonas shigelloides]|uniref:hypothetical protein n=1 Tax=Plesiomonas shigelloides TaxID=703 RepID=UPI000D58401E|nr:hypothetical protein [Plesiomonas shigelloides]PVU65082.1 hypothetical protein C9E85_14710 [Plesiomonas shigelloides]